MSRVEEIEQAVSELPPSQLARFRKWFAEFDADAWDEQFESDVKSGKLDALADAALQQYRRGEAKEI